MFEDGCVACHERGGGEAEDLPVGEVPGHDGENGAEWTEGDITFAGVARNFFVGEETLCIVGEIVTGPCALLNFSLSLDDRFPHFEDSGTRKPSLVLA